jgi:phosphoserine phosphatase RsbU/P
MAWLPVPHKHGSRWFHSSLLVLAAVFAAASTVYTYFSTVAGWPDQPPAVELGLVFPFQPRYVAFVVTTVKPGSPAERAGIQVEDKIVAFDGQQVRYQGDQVKTWRLHRPGDSVRLTILRKGETAPFERTAVFRPNSTLTGPPGSPQEAAGLILRSSAPLAFAIVGLIILLLRPQSLNVWLLAWFFAGIIASAGFPDDFQSVPASLRPWVEMYHGLFLGMIGASFYFLCAVFPAPSPIDRRWPWLKWVGVVLGLAIVADTNTPDLSHPVPTFSRFMNSEAAGRVAFGAAMAFVVLGLISLASSYFFARQPESRRKIRVIYWGTVIGLAPPLLRAIAQQYSAFRAPGWLEMILNVMLLLVPASFAYAVFKQHVLDVPVLLRRSARYVLVQRGFLLLLCLVSFGLTMLFAASLENLPRMATGMGQSPGVALGAVFGTAILWGGSQVHKQVSNKIDRAFFRSAYDARIILENLAQSSRAATNRDALAQLLVNQLTTALQPASLAVYLAATNGNLDVAAGEAPPALQTISASSPLLVQLALREEPRDLPDGPANAGGIAVPAAFVGGCLVPMLNREGQLVGMVALGRRLSEEPYSGEDKRLLASVASQAAMAIENFRLARDIADKLEAERRTTREMEIAKDVQSRLLPQVFPQLQTLECAGRCLQARSVGGDYYDFLELGCGQVGLMLADVSGKGVHAALLMANLQANLRSLAGLMGRTTERVMPCDLAATLQQVNTILWRSTAPQHYATLFFGLYDDLRRTLTYANCGHNPPIVLAADGHVERLECTTTVIGLFGKWECETGEIELHPGDLLAIFSDGVTEAMRGEEEYGESRFLNVLRETSRQPPGEIVTSVFNSVQTFSAGNQSDDLTLVIAKAKAAAF